MTKQNLELYIEKPNLNACYSNLQFSLDAVSYGIEYAEIGESKSIPGGYSWDTPYGRLEQVDGVLNLIENTISPDLYTKIEIQG
jgi:hypothetical protein